MKFKIQAGAEIDAATPGEVDGIVSGSQKAYFAEMARGIKQIRFFGTGVVDAAKNVTVPGVGGEPLGPNPGFSWAVQRVAVWGLTAGQTVEIHRNSIDGTQFIGTLSTAAPALMLGEAGCLLNGGELLYVIQPPASALTAAQILQVNGEATEAPAYAIWKLFQ